MSKYIKFLSVFLLTFIINTSPVFSMDTKENITNTMLELGFENIYVSSSGKFYEISFENRTFLHEIHALGALLSAIKPFIEEDANLKIFPQSNGKVITEINFDYIDYLSFMEDRITEAELAERMKINMSPDFSQEEKVNPLFLHTDLVLAPSYNIDMTNGPSILFSPHVQTFFDNGLVFTVRYSLPVYNIVNNFDFNKNFALLPPGFTNAHLDYTTPIFNLPLTTMFRAGYWDNGGPNMLLSNATQYNLMDGLITLNLNSGASYNFQNGRADFTVLPYSQLYLGFLDLFIEGGGGKFMYSEYGVWGRILRQFHNTDIGFSLYRTFGQPESGWKMLFSFTLALGPEQSIKAAPIRVTYPRFFTGNLFAGKNVGFTHPSTFLMQDTFLKRLFPEYIKNHLYYWKEYKSEL